MHLNYYIKTKDRAHIDNFIRVCKECNIPVDLDDADLDDGEILGIGLFTQNSETQVMGINNPTIDDIKYDVTVYLLDEIASWWKKLKLSEYESFIRNFDLNGIKTSLYNKLIECKEKFPEFTLGCEMVSNVDLEYEFFRYEFHNRDYVPYILNGYCYCDVSNKWGPRTSKGYGHFEGFKLWNKNLLLMNKKQIKKLIK